MIYHRICVVFVVIFNPIHYGSEFHIKRSIRPLTADIINSTTVVLKGLPQHTNNPSCPITGYKVRVKQEGTKRPQVRDVEGVRQTITLQYLQPNATYHIRLVTLSCDGKGKQSKKLTVKIPPLSSEIGQPEITNFKGYPDSIFLSWKAPYSTIPLIGYIVGYGEGVPDVNWQYFDINTKNCTIRNLKRNTQYLISLRARHSDDIKGPPAHELVSTVEHSDPDPPQAPINLRAKATSPTTIMLEWSDPSSPSSHKPIDNRYYSVHYSHTNPTSGKIVEKSESFRKSQVVISNLTPAVSYEFKVRTVNEGFYGEYSSIVHERTAETAPGSQPRSVSAHILTIDEETKVVSALVKWKPPRLTNSNVTDYEIRYTDRLDLIYGDCQIASVRQQTEVVIENLIFGNTYYIQVQAKNAFGYGPKSDIVKFQTNVKKNPVSPLTLPPTSASSAAVGDEKEEQDSAKNDDLANDKLLENLDNQYLYDYDEEYDGDFDNQQDASSHSQQQYPDVPKRKRKQTISFPDDSSEDHPSSHKTRPSHVNVDFKVILQVKVNAFITWPVFQPSINAKEGGGAKCQDAAEKPKGYKIRYRKYEQQQQQLHQSNNNNNQQQHQQQPWLNRSLKDNMAVLEDLEVNCKYVYQVKYLVGGESSWSHPQFLSTYPHQDQLIN